MITVFSSTKSVSNFPSKMAPNKAKIENLNLNLNLTLFQKPNLLFDALSKLIKVT